MALREKENPESISHWTHSFRANTIGGRIYLVKKICFWPAPDMLNIR